MKEVVDAFLSENEWALDYWCGSRGRYCFQSSATVGECNSLCQIARLECHLPRYSTSASAYVLPLLLCRLVIAVRRARSFQETRSLQKGHHTDEFSRSCWTWERCGLRAARHLWDAWLWGAKVCVGPVSAVLWLLTAGMTYEMSLNAVCWGPSILLWRRLLNACLVRCFLYCVTFVGCGMEVRIFGSWAVGESTFGGVKSFAANFVDKDWWHQKLY